MALSYQKRQKEMKRLEKQRGKAERRMQKKLEKRAAKEASTGEENAVATMEPDSSEMD